MSRLIVHTDGAARGNPGPAGIGVALYREGEDDPAAVIAEAIGDATNNVAEYKALLRGLSEALLRGADAVEVRTDSELMARQLSGRYKVSAPQLAPLHAEARALLARFAQAAVVHVPRAKNALADRLANQGIDAQSPAAQRSVAPPGWRSEKGALRKTFTFASFAESVRFVERLARAAEDAGRTPDIDIRGERVTVTLTAPDKDDALVREADAAAQW